MFYGNFNRTLVNLWYNSRGTMDKTLIWLTVVKRKKASCPTVFQRSLSWIDSKALKEAEPYVTTVDHTDIRGLVTA